jgi:hypothetical protein
MAHKPSFVPNRPSKFTGQTSVSVTQAERVGFSKALADRFFAFNAMPKTEVFTGIYLSSHPEHESHKKRSLTPISLITVWTVLDGMDAISSSRQKPPPLSTRLPPGLSQRVATSRGLS